MSGGLWARIHGLAIGGVISLLLSSAGCAVVQRPSRATGGEHHDRKSKLDGLLALSNGAAVAGATLRLICAKEERRLHTDRRGRFTVVGLAEGKCLLICPAANFRQAVEIRANLLRQDEIVRFTIPPRRTVWLSWSSATPPGTRSFVVEDGLPILLRRAGLTVKLERLGLSVNGTLYPLKVGLTIKRKDPTAQTIKVDTISERSILPPGLRGEPRRDAINDVNLGDGERLVALKSLLSKRTLLLIDRCDHIRPSWRADVDGVEGSYGAIGLKALAIATSSCPAGREKSTNHVHDITASTDLRGDLFFGGADLLWALKARAGQVLVLDESGAVLHRISATKHAPLDGALSLLERSWPKLAALRRVSVRRADSVMRAEEGRLLSQAVVHLKAGQPSAADLLLLRILKRRPDNAEARRQRALTRAMMGDLSGALDQVRWWRTAFGDVSADELMDEVERQSKTAALGLRSR